MSPRTDDCLYDRCHVPEHMRRLDLDEIRKAARYAAMWVKVSKGHVIDVEPDDGTRYRFAVNELTNNGGERLGRYWVSISPGGRAYEWSGAPMTDAGYVSGSWKVENRWTAVVACLFLTALADELAEWTS